MGPVGIFLCPEDGRAWLGSTREPGDKMLQQIICVSEEDSHGRSDLTVLLVPLGSLLGQMVWIRHQDAEAQVLGL